MILNERQYGITKTKLKEFNEAIALLSDRYGRFAQHAAQAFVSQAQVSRPPDRETLGVEYAACKAAFPPTKDINEQIYLQANIDSLKSQIEDFQEEIAEYEQLKQGNIKKLVLDSFEDLPIALIKARIIRGLTQAQLAEKLNVKHQQVQRDENNRYASASFTKLLNVQNALDLEIKETVIFK